MDSDILSNLGQVFPHVMGQILSYLEPEELCVLSCVSQKTKLMVVNDPNASKRREDHLKALRELKQEVGHENWPIKKTTPEVKSENRIALNEVKNAQAVTVKPTPQPEVRKVKRRRVNFNENVISSTPIVRTSRKRGSVDSLGDQDSGYFEETTSKMKSRTRKCEPTAGSKASKRQLKRL